MKKWALLFVFCCSCMIWMGCESTPTLADYSGIWKVVMIERDRLNMPPSGMWYEIHGDTTYTMGNGEVIVDSGSISLLDNQVLAIQSRIKVDNDSEWSISESNDTLIWKGTDTKVNSNGLTMQMVSTTTKPKHPSEEILGRWLIQEYTQDSVGVKNPFGDWVEFYPNGKCLFHPSDSGTWSMNPHVPIMNTQCPSKQLLNQWLISFDGKASNWKEVYDKTTLS